VSIKLHIEVAVPTNMPQPDVMKWVQRILVAINEPGEHISSIVRVIDPHGQTIGEFAK
jgi:hypothetical protein